MLIEYVAIGAGTAVALNLLTLAITLFLYFDPSDQIDWNLVLVRGIMAAAFGGWVGLFIAIIVQITF